MRKISLVLVLVFFMMMGSASAAIVELSISDLNQAGQGTMMVAYTGASTSTIWINTTDDVVWMSDPLTGNNFEYLVFYIACDEVYTAEMYTGGSLVATDSIQRTDAGCNDAGVSFSQESYACDSTIQVNHIYAQNSTINIRDGDNYANILWTIANINGSGALYPEFNFTPGFSYIVDIQLDGSTSDFDSMNVQLCSGEDSGGGTDGGGGTDDGTGSGGAGSGGAGSGGGTDPFTQPNSYDPTVPGHEWKQLLDLNNDGVNSYAESIAAFRYWGFTFLFSSYGMAFFKFVLGVKLW